MSGETTVTEAEWLVCNDPVQLLGYLDRPQGDRKLLLFAIACCRTIWPLLPQPEMRAGIEVAEQFAEGKATLGEMSEADWHLEGALYGGVEYCTNRPGSSLPEEIARWLAAVEALSPDHLKEMACCGGEDLPSDLLTLLTDAGYFADHVLIMHNCQPHDPTLQWYRRFLQVSRVRDIFGNPFQLIPLSPAVRDWNDGLVVRLAQTAYDDRQLPEGTLDNCRLAILADALEEAGCTDPDILGHLRGPGPHVRGCWPVDLLLGKS